MVWGEPKGEKKGLGTKVVTPKTKTEGQFEKPVVIAPQETQPTPKQNNNNLDWLDDETESILIFGPPKHGKTYAYLSYIEDTIKKGGHVYIASTDGGVPRTMKRYFADVGNPKVKEFVKGKITYKHIYSMDDMRGFWTQHKDKIVGKDLFIIDLVSRFWEWLQADFIDFVSRGHITNYVMNAMNDPKKFGLMESSKWNYIKAAHRFIEDIIDRKKCHVIGVCTEKDTEGEKAIGGSRAEGKLRKIYLTDMSVRAGGQRELPYLFDTMVRIAMVGEGKFACLIVGDRGFKPDGKVVEYGTNLKTTIEKFRREN